jgi:hypothetical protein
MLDGLLLGSRRAIAVFSRAGFDISSPDGLVALVNGQERVVRSRISDDALRAWRERGRFSLGVQPYTYADGGPKPALAADALRTQLAAARLLGSRDLWIEADAKEALPPPDANGPGYRTPLDGLEWIGPLPVDGAKNLCVLRGAETAAIASLSGIDQRIAFERQSSPVTVTNLATGQIHTVPPVDGRVTLDPVDYPVLIEGLPVRDWVTPAGLWMTLGDPSEPGYRSAPLRYGWTNRTGLTVTGTLESASPVHD